MALAGALCSELCLTILNIIGYINRVSTTPGNLLEFKNPPGNPGNLLEFNWSSWKFLCKMIDRIGFRSYTGYQIAYLSTNWSPYFSFATAHGVLNAYHYRVFLLYLAKLHCKSSFGTG